MTDVKIQFFNMNLNMADPIISTQPGGLKFDTSTYFTLVFSTVPGEEIQFVAKKTPDIPIELPESMGGGWLLGARKVADMAQAELIPPSDGTAAVTRWKVSLAEDQREVTEVSESGWYRLQPPGTDLTLLPGPGGQAVLGTNESLALQIMVM